MEKNPRSLSTFLVRLLRDGRGAFTSPILCAPPPIFGRALPGRRPILRPDAMPPLANPSTPGAGAFDQVVDAASNLNDGANPQLSQFAGFDAPTPNFVTRRIDLSAF